MFNGRFRRRSWGWWFVLLDRKHFKVKLLRFSAGKQLSVQYHNFRSELWLFLTGRERGEYWNVPKGNIHTYQSPSAVYILEIQYGEKCVEEDIVRL